MKVRRSTRVCAGVIVVVLSALLWTLPAGAGTHRAVRAAQQGVTKDAIEMVVIVPDIDSLKAKGISTTSRSSTGGFAKKFTTYVDAFGPINGRKVDVKTVGWDPIDPTSYDKACTSATQDNKPFVVVNGTGYLTSAIPCIAVDNKTPFVYGDMSYAALDKGSGKNLVSLREPVEDTALTAADIVAKAKLIPKTAKIGILSNNVPSLKAAGDTLEAALKKRGYDVVSTVEVNGLSSSLGQIQQAATAAVATFQAAGVDTVFHDQSFQAVSSFFSEADRTGAGFKEFAIDTQANGCSPGGSAAGNLVASAGGMLCISPWAGRTKPDKSGLLTDTAFEAKCRKEYDAATGLKSAPGSPSGDITVNGVTYSEDFPAPECNLANVLLPAIKKAGKDLTWDKVYANILNTTKAPMAYGSEGQGGYGKNKKYLPTQAHVMELTVANKDTPKDANGLFNGCPVPANCWVPKLINGQEWYPIKTS